MNGRHSEFGVSPTSKFVNGSAENQEYATNARKRQFDQEQFADYELIQSPELTMIVETISQGIGEFVKRYGGKPIAIRPDHVHFYDTSNLPESAKDITGFGKGRDKDTVGYYKLNSQSIGILLNGERASDPAILANRLAHEMIHFSSFHSFRINENTENEEAETATLSVRRVGIQSENKSGNDWFSAINEAVTEELAIRFMNESFAKIPFIAKSVGPFLHASLAESPSYLAVMEELRNITNNMGVSPEVAATHLTSKLDDDVTLLLESPYSAYSKSVATETYVALRMVLKVIIKDIQEANSSNFASEEDVFRVFASAAMTGQLLPLARLIKETYGSGAIRELASMGSADTRFSIPRPLNKKQ